MSMYASTTVRLECGTCGRDSRFRVEAVAPDAVDVVDGFHGCECADRPTDRAALEEAVDRWWAEDRYRRGLDVDRRLD